MKFNLFIILFLLSCAGIDAREGAIQCANLIYGGTHTSKCFSDEFLSAVQRETAIATERRFKSVKLSSDELFRYPFVIITGEDDFHFTSKERENLKKYLESGGFMLASAGCSSKKWNAAFRREIAGVMGKEQLKAVPMDHPVFQTLHKIKELKLTHSTGTATLEGVEHGGKLVVIFSPHGLNDTHHTQGCCCCGGNEIGNSLEVNTNIFIYAILH